MIFINYFNFHPFRKPVAAVKSSPQKVAISAPVAAAKPAATETTTTSQDDTKTDSKPVSQTAEDVRQLLCWPYI